MAFFRRYSIYGAVYLFAGVAVLFTHYYRSSAYNKAELDEKLTLVAASHFHLSQLVDNLPAVFRENSHAAALKISDLKGSFLGAMYDARRMTAAEYKIFLDTKIFDPKNPAVPGYEFHVWESKRRKLRILALSLHRMQIGEYLAVMGRDYALHYIIPLYILAGILGFAAFHYFLGERNPVQRRRNGAATKPGIIASVVKMPAKTQGHAWQLKSGVIAEGSIHSALQALRSLAGAASASLYVKAGAWRPVAEVRGALSVRGEAMDLPRPLAAVSTDNSEILISPDKSEWLFFNAPAHAAQLCFVVRFRGAPQDAASSLTTQVAAFVKANSRSLLVEHYYENSILDAESGLYSSPYAMFTLKEKILAGQPFAAASYRFGDADFAPPSLVKIARSAIRVMREHFPAEEAPVVARGQANTILVIFNARRGDRERNLKAAQQLYSVYANLGKKAAGGFIDDVAGCGSGARVLKIFERLSETSSTSGQLALYKAQSQLNVL